MTSKTIDDPSRYYTLPSGILGDGSSLDAGAAQLIDNNISHLVRVSQRHLAWWPLTINLVNFGGAGPTPYTGYVDASEPGTLADYQRIPWARGANAVIFGPFDLIVDRETDAGLMLRTIRVVIGKAVASTGTSLQLYFAITPDRELPRNGVFYAWSGRVNAPSGTNRVVYDLESTALSHRYVTRTCRVSSATGSRTVQVVSASIAVGFYSTANSQSVGAISVYEKR